MTGRPAIDALSRNDSEPIDRLKDECCDHTGCFSPKAAIARNEGASSGSEPPSLVQARLRELPADLPCDLRDGDRVAANCSGA